MLTSLLLYVITFVASLLIAVLPDASAWPLPIGYTNGWAFISELFGTAAVFLPEGGLEAVGAALSFVILANAFVIPWLAARHFKLPFVGIHKG